VRLSFAVDFVTFLTTISFNNKESLQRSRKLSMFPQIFLIETYRLI